MSAVIELYEDRQSGWRVLACRRGTIGYRFIIVDRAGRSTFAADAMELARGKVPAGLEQVDLDVDSPHGMVLTEPCALWSRGRVRRTGTKPGVLTAAYVSGELNPGAVAAEDRGTSPTALGGQGRPHRVRVDGDRPPPHLVVLSIGDRRPLEAGQPARGVTRNSETILASKAIVPVNPLRGPRMPRTASNGSTTRGRRGSAVGPDTRLVVSQITELVAANERLQRANRELAGENQRLRGELTAIGSALGSLTGGLRGRGRGGATAFALPEARPRRRRRPITDPEVLARRSAALARARAARAEKLAAAKAAAAAG